tara:strand:- start:526 stop:855 length:330 start_codon:yes stop_codon:yes gene_type:complete
MARKLDWSKHNARTDAQLSTESVRSDEAYQREMEWGKIRFGKHKGKTLQQVPINYLKWIVNTWLPNSKFTKAQIQNAQHEITQRQNIASTTARTKVENPKISVLDANKH